MPATPEQLHAPESNFLLFAAIALDCHRTVDLPSLTGAATRRELDDLHGHLIALHHLIDAHTTRTAPIADAEGDHLKAARTHLWQAAEQLHHAYHHAPHADGATPDRDVCRRRTPEGAPELTVCQRHIGALTRVRRHATPADLRKSAPGPAHRTKEK
ncbi:DUF6238 family protein [Embleya sp. NPDC059259]|uniref:DUF6238 family protein n=1 Tax=unclassified Embleya TaxID=2699296 RepID=UPI0036BA0857